MVCNKKEESLKNTVEDGKEAITKRMRLKNFRDIVENEMDSMFSIKVIKSSTLAKARQISTYDLSAIQKIG